MSMALAYTFFFFFLFGFIPLMFCSGKLASISEVWRQDLAILVDNQKLWTTKAKVTVKQRKMIHNGHQREKHLQTTMKGLDSSEIGLIAFSDILNSNIVGLQRALSTDPKAPAKKSYGCGWRSQENVSEVYNPVVLRTIFEQAATRFLARAHRFELPREEESGENDKYVDEEGFAEFVAILGQHFAIRDRERKHSGIPQKIRDRKERDIERNNMKKLFNALQEKNDNIARVFAEFSESSRAHMALDHKDKDKEQTDAKEDSSSDEEMEEWTFLLLPY